MELMLTCRRCGYQWKRRTLGRLPKSCPECKARNWDEDEVRGRGRPPKVFSEDPLTITADTVAEFQAEEHSPVAAVLDVPMVESTEPQWDQAEPIPLNNPEHLLSLHPADCRCTNCLWERGAL